MILNAVLERFKEKSPLTVMAHLCLSRALDDQWLDALFARYSQAQYTRELLFSTAVELMSHVCMGLVTSVHAAAKKMKETLTVSVTSVYNKINGAEPAVLRALVREGAERLLPVAASLEPAPRCSVPGFRLRIADGNHLAASDKRMKVLRKFRGAALPAQTLVVYDPDRELVVDLIPCEDAHTQERVLMRELLPQAQPGDLWIADRNFCTTAILTGFIGQQACFLVREHGANPNPEVAGEIKQVACDDSGAILEQKVSIQDAAGVLHELRRIEVHLATPSRSGARVIRLLTNVPARQLGAKELAALYRRRWRIEAMFQRLESVLASEIKSLGQPRAALFAFSVAILAYNVLSLLATAMRVEHAQALASSGMEISTFYIAAEVRADYNGMRIAVDEKAWIAYENLDVEELAQELRVLARGVDPRRVRSHPRKPKTVVRKGYVSRREASRHVATARVMKAGKIV